MKTLRKIFRTRVARLLLVILSGVLLISLALGLVGGAALGFGVGVVLTVIVVATFGINKAFDWVLEGDY